MKGARLVIVTLGALGFLAGWMAFPEGKGRGIEPGAIPPVTDGTFVKGLHYKVYKNGSPASEAEIDDLRIVPRNFFVFRIKSINEAVITNARIRLYDPSQKRRDDPFRSLFKEFTDQENGFGLITRAVVKGIDVNMYHAQKVTHHLTAAKADLMAGSNQTAFYDATIEHPSSKTVVRAAKLLWDTQERKFVVPGRYTLSGPGGDVKGEGVQIDMNFKMKQLRSL